MRELARSSVCLDRLDTRDRAFAMRLAMGVTAARGALDGMLDGLFYLYVPAALR